MKHKLVVRLLKTEEGIFKTHIVLQFYYFQCEGKRQELDHTTKYTCGDFQFSLKVFTLHPISRIRALSRIAFTKGLLIFC